MAFGLATLYNNVYTPTLNGQSVFGAPSSFTSVRFNGTAAQADTFLGNANGTTKFAPGMNGTAWAITGVLTGVTSAAVSTAQATLVACGGLPPVEFGRGTGEAFPDDYEHRTNCYFLATDLVFASAGIVEVTPYSYTLAYSLILRQIGDGTRPT